MMIVINDNDGNYNNTLTASFKWNIYLCVPFTYYLKQMLNKDAFFLYRINVELEKNAHQDQKGLN